jgi:predicted dinucleotide-binding enzyme
LSPFLRRIFQTWPVCSPIRLTAWWSSIQATTTRANATAASKQLRQVYRRASGSFEQQLGRPVIKAFNNIYAKHLLELGRPKGTPGRIALPVSGDDSAAKSVVLKLIDELGFDGVDAGGLDESWRQQPGTPVYTEDFDAEGVRRALAEAIKDRTPEWRATDGSPGSFTSPA